MTWLEALMFLLVFLVLSTILASLRGIVIRLDRIDDALQNLKIKFRIVPINKQEQPK